MLSREENDLLTRTGAGTPMGDLMRRYWIPALLSKQLSEPDCAPVRMQLMGEKLVAFRDSKGRLGLLDEQCPHRTASLFFGRNNKDNDYLIDRDLQKSGKSYTGMRGLGVQDAAIQESMGPIANRTKEHLGVSDSAIIQIRKILLQSLKDFEAGKEPPGLDSKSYRVRSTQFTLPHGEALESEIARQLANPDTLDFTKLGTSPRK